MNDRQNELNSSSNSNGDDLIKYLESLRENWYDLTAIYRTPISSILPEEREVCERQIYENYNIEAIAERLRDAPGTISTTTLLEWLNQFDSFMEKNIAYLLLREIQFFSEHSIKLAVKQLREKLQDFLIDQEQLSEAFHSLPNPPIKSEINFKKWLRNKVIRYAWLPQPPTKGVESQHTLWGYYEIYSLTGSGTSCPPASKPRLLKDYFENSWYNDPENVVPENTVFVFMDYVNGTGKQLSACLPLIDNLLEQYPKWRKSYFIFMYITQSQKIQKDKIKFSTDNWEFIYYEPILFYNDSKILKILSEHKISEIEYKIFAEKYCKRAGRTSLGYHNSAFLTCFYRSCPDNTLTFFWNSDDKKKWKAIFEDSQTPGGAPYRQK